MNESIIALISAIFGGAGLKVLEVWLTRGRVKDDTATAFRNELRQELLGLRQELNDVETELDTWKKKYYDLLDQFIQVKNEIRDKSGP